jgi:WD40-like Beta Propeller Repeat
MDAGFVVELLMQPNAIYSPVFASDSLVLAVWDTPGQQNLFSYHLRGGVFDFASYRHITHARFPVVSAQGQISFSGRLAGGKNNYGLFTAKLDGTECILRSRPNEESDVVFSPAHFSPDGNTLLMPRAYGGKFEVHLFDIKRNQTRKRMQGGRAPRWSPDGKQIACHVYSWKEQTKESIVVVSNGGRTVKYV